VHRSFLRVKIVGNNSRFLTLTGSIAAVNHTLYDLTLLLRKPGHAKLRVFVSDGNEATLAALAVARS
jgi:hypothetical protein